MTATSPYSLCLWLLVAATLIDISSSTKCYVCGDNSSVSEKCVDEYPVSQRPGDIKDCSASAVKGCMKSKYVDSDNNQIVTRGCAPEVGMRHTPNDCKSTEVAGSKVYFCHCTEDFCNGSDRISHNILLISVTVVAGALGHHWLL